MICSFVIAHFFVIRKNNDGNDYDKDDDDNVFTIVNNEIFCLDLNCILY